MKKQSSSFYLEVQTSFERNKQRHKNVLCNGFQLSSHTKGFLPKNAEVKTTRCSETNNTTRRKYCSKASFEWPYF